MKLRRTIIVTTVISFFLFSQADVYAEYSRESKHGFYVDNIVVSNTTLVLNEPINRKIEEIGGNIASKTGRKNLRYTFRIVNDPVINCYSAAGGFVYINSGLLDILTTEDEVAAVLAHEIAHVSENHQIEYLYSMEEKRVASGIAGVALGAALGAAGSMIVQSALPAPSPYYPSPFADLAVSQAYGTGTMIGEMVGGEMGIAMIKGYSKSQELEADALAIQYLKDAGYDQNALISVFKKLAGIRNRLKLNEKNYISNLINAEPGIDVRTKKMEDIISKGR